MFGVKTCPRWPLFSGPSLTLTLFVLQVVVGVGDTKAFLTGAVSGSLVPRGTSGEEFAEGTRMILRLEAGQRGSVHST